MTAIIYKPNDDTKDSVSHNNVSNHNHSTSHKNSFEAKDSNSNQGNARNNPSITVPMTANATGTPHNTHSGQTMDSIATTSHLTGLPTHSLATLNPVKNKPLHIVLVTETWLPEVNGVSLSLKQLMTQLVAMGHSVSLIKPRAKGEQTGNRVVYTPSKLTPHKPTSNTAGDYELQNRHLQVCSGSNDTADEPIITHTLSVKGMPIPRYPELQFGMPAYSRIKHYLQDIQPDIVHIATEGPLGLAALLAAKRLKIAVTTGYHTQFHDFSKHFGMGLLARPLIAYFKYFHNWSDATCVPSPKTQHDLANFGFKRLFQVGRGVDTERFNPSKSSEALRQSWGAGQQHTVLIMVSRLSPEKGVDLVIKSYQALQMQQLHRAIKLIIVGDGPDKARLQTLAMGSEDIIFTGAQMGEALAQHYASGDAFIFASQVETFGNVVTEAMASGLPIYAFDDAAAGMLVDEDCGALVELGDRQHFIQMVSELPKVQQLKQLGEQARERVLSMTWGRPTEQMLTMFKDVLASKASNQGKAQSFAKKVELLRLKPATDQALFKQGVSLPLRDSAEVKVALSKASVLTGSKDPHSHPSH